ncbi:bifunctional glycosyltransferase family 2/GtrA family protein [uncultured Desulfobacter sp.]|uniref:bifunctional glycosyltransferase family 2/GtrA family protein n=1 Tax=uncultured Desulfobacter sp. TaxID=240139 RepID=UPI0029F5B649|nr:bifunctional glycosyltransferase family 2/GtrA family protein [uncultured Desulfobacter sp.]
MNQISLVIPCFNEENTLEACINRVLEVPDINFEIIIVDDASTDGSLGIARRLEEKYPQVHVLSHSKNQGKGAALRTGFKKAHGDFVAVQDADLEYDPMDLKKLVAPLAEGYADVVLGSRFLSTEPRRVLYFWHALGNKFLTFLSNMFTDLNLTDMETCYKVFKKEVIQNIDIQESRFGVEPELVAKIARMGLRIYERGISYKGRTYEDGKKIGMKDGFWAIFCILRYNVHNTSLPAQSFLNLILSGFAAVVNLLCFLGLFHSGTGLLKSAALAFFIAIVVNYGLCISIRLPPKARWPGVIEMAIFLSVVAMAGLVDVKSTQLLIAMGWTPSLSNLCAGTLFLLLNFMGRRFMVFPISSKEPLKKIIRSFPRSDL